MTKKQAFDRISEACEDAMGEARAGRWRSVDKLLRTAADTAAAMNGRPVRPRPVSAVDVTEARYSQSLERGLRILELFQPDAPVWGIADIADALGYSRSTTHRYAVTLVRLGQIEQTGHRKYRLAVAD
jgi:hypothetical protein